VPAEFDSQPARADGQAGHAAMEVKADRTTGNGPGVNRRSGDATSRHSKARYWKIAGKTVVPVYLVDDGVVPDTLVVRIGDPTGQEQTLFRKDVYDADFVSLDRSQRLVRSDGGAVSEPIPSAEIEVNTQRHVVVDQTIRALANDLDLYTRGESLGVVIREEGDTAKLQGGITLESAMGMMRFSPLTQSVLSCYITKNANYTQIIQTRYEEKVVDVHPPGWLIAAVHEKRSWPRIRHLLSITNCPYVRADGSLPLSGYDPTIATLYRPSVLIERLPDRPSQDDAREAAKSLYDLVAQFPFDTDDDFPVWLAYLLNVVQRPVIGGPTPGYVFHGNKAGCGKGLLIDLGGIIVHGHCVGTRTHPTDDVEAEKVKLALGLSGAPIIHFDNVREGGYYGGGVMDSMLTSTVVSGRILGQSRDSGPVPLRPTWTISGNNISPMGDSYRRWLTCNLTTTLESPHERDDIECSDLRGYARGHRAELLRHALIILKTHAVAGRPVATIQDEEESDRDWAPLGSFEEWDPIVRGAVHFATDRDCLATQRKGDEDSPQHQSKSLMLRGLREFDPARLGNTAEEIFRAATLAGVEQSYPTLHSAFANATTHGKPLDLKGFQYLLRSMKKTPIDGMRLEVIGENRNGQSVWTVVDVLHF
jgi:hypothetical protein